MATVTIGTNTYESYATVAQADEYLLASPNFATWDVLSDDEKGRFLVTATRYLDSLNWKESCLPLTDTGNTNTATILIAEQAALGNVAFLGLSAPEDAPKRLKAGSTEIEFNSRPWFVTTGNRLPMQIMALIKDCLAGSGTSYGIQTFGTDGTSGASIYRGDYDLIDD